MAVMSVRIDDKKRKALKIIASIEGRSMGGIVTELIDRYIDDKKAVLINLSESENLINLMKLSERSFSDWNNDADEIYDDL